VTASRRYRARRREHELEQAWSVHHVGEDQSKGRSASSLQFAAVYLVLETRFASTSRCSFFTVAANFSVAFSNALNASSHSICSSA
jgi:hypothetical protein